MKWRKCRLSHVFRNFISISWGGVFWFPAKVLSEPKVTDAAPCSSRHQNAKKEIHQATNDDYRNSTFRPEGLFRIPTKVIHKFWPMCGKQLFRLFRHGPVDYNIGYSG